MNVNTQNKKYKWTKEDNIICSSLYLCGIKYDEAYKILNHIPINSVKMKFANSLFLDKGNVPGSLSNCSKEHIKIFNEIKQLISNV